jgi:hypothetical protein
LDVAAASKVATEWYSKALGSATGKKLNARALDDYEGMEADDDDDERVSIVPLLLAGKVAQATLFATHAYANEEGFRKLTGLQNARMLSCPEQDTQVQTPRQFSTLKQC